jgi:hypothetical protein
MPKLSSALTIQKNFFYKKNEDGTYTNYQILDWQDIKTHYYRGTIYFLVDIDNDPDNFFPMLETDISYTQGWKYNCDNPVYKEEDINK